MQMTISTTGRRLLCILCSVYVLSKMLKLCGAEGSSFRWLMGAVSCQLFLLRFIKPCFWSGSRCWAAFVCLEVHQIDPLWCCCPILINVFSGWDPSDIVSEVVLFLRWRIGCCQPFVVAALVQLRGTIFGCCQLFVVGSASWCLHQTHWLLGFVRVFGSDCPLLRSIRLCFRSGSLFNAECSETRLVRWWACSGSNHLTRVNG